MEEHEAFETLRALRAMKNRCVFCVSSANCIVSRIVTLLRIRLTLNCDIQVFEIEIHMQYSGLRVTAVRYKSKIVD